MNSVAIIGGGITGLTAAFRLQQRGIPVILYEAGNRVGGVIQSVRQDGFLAECGPNTILETSPKISALINDLGLEGRRMYSDPAAANRYLVRDGKLVPLPDSFLRFLRTPLFSTAAKLRLLAEPFIGPAAADCEESVAEFVLRRLGREFLDYAINPLVGGVYAGDPARLSVKQAFPKLNAVEQKYHSLIVGQFLGSRERKRRAEVSKQNANKLSFDEGLQVLTDELARQLGSAVRLGSPVTAIQQTKQGWVVAASIDGKQCWTGHSAVFFAGTAHRLAQLQILAENAPDLSSLSEIYYPPVASIVLGFRRQDVAHPLDGFGMLIPQVEGFDTLGAVFSSSLFQNRAPAGQVTLTSYLGGARNPDLALQEPAALVRLVVEDLRKLLGVRGRPTFEHQFVYRKAIPQYEVGYGQFKELMSRAETKCPGLFLGGHYRDGISLGDSLVSGHDTAARIGNYLASSGADLQPSDLQIKAAA
jgi:oxygen-dependent protoporphyrinogen oxidase